MKLLTPLAGYLRRMQIWRPLIVAVILLGVLFAQQALAAFSLIQFEAENGTLSGGTYIGSDSNAVGGGYVRFGSQQSGNAITTPLKQSTVNSRYYVDGNGKAVLLVGSHTWNNFQDFGNNGQIQTLNFDAYVDMMVTNKQNFTLLWNTEMPKFCNLPTGANGNYDVTPMPWQRTGPGNASDGKLKFDLTKYNQAFFDRMRARVQQLGENGIYAGVYLFTGEWLNIFRCGAADGYPLTGSNNINNVDAGSGNGGTTMQAPNAVTAVQDLYIEKMIDTLNDLPNVLWGTSEEANENAVWWNNHVIDKVKAYEATKPFKHPVGFGVYAGTQDSQAINNSHASWYAPGVRYPPGNNCGYAAAPTCKVFINDSDHSYFGMWNESQGSNRDWIWTNMMQGSSAVFMDPWVLYYPREGRNMCANPNQGICSGPDNRYANFRANMGYTREYADRMDLLNTAPCGNRSSVSNCIYKNSATAPEYLIYKGTTGGFTVNLSGSTKTLAVEWLNPATGVKTMGATVTAGSSQSFTAPFSGDAVLYLH